MASSNYFFWLRWFNVILDAFWWIFLMLIIFAVPPLRVWWWVFAPLLLSFELNKLYLWWVNWDFYYARIKWVVLEVIPPKEVLTPLKAMEDVFSVMWGPLVDNPTWRERFCEGELQEGPFWMSWEIAGIEGNIHFYLRVMEGQRTALETALYAHYPELEIREVTDYTKDVPQNIPNEEWNVYGEDFILGKEAFYPIKTYEKFFEPQGEKISAEEKRIDPLASLLESMSKLGTGEQFWLQFIITSIGDNNEPGLRKGAEKLIAKIARRQEKKDKTFTEEILDAIHWLVVGPPKEVVGDKIIYKKVDPAKSESGEREMVITPGEREIITEVENKIKKPIFRTYIRGVYVAKRENWNTSNRIMTRAYFGHFQTQNLNYLRFSASTRPKTHYFFRKRIPFLRSRRQFVNYVLRFAPHFPNRKKESNLLNPEELATLFHFPIKITGLAMPTMARVESKKGGPPHNLPVE